MDNRSLLLTYLKAIISSGSITAAAQKLYISQPYLSRYIHEAEDELGAQLLDRKQRPIALTDIGAKFLQGIETLDSDYNQLLSQITEMTYQQTSHIRLGINQSISTEIAPVVARQYLIKYPQNHISFEELPSRNLEKQLLDQEIDFHIRMLPIFPNQISYQPLGQFAVYLVVNHSSALFDPHHTTIQTDFDPAKIANADFITLHAGSGFMRLIELFLTSNRLKIKRRFEMRYIETAVRMAYAGLGCTFVPSFFASAHFDATRCNVYKLPLDTLSANLALAYLRDRPLTQAMREFMHVIDLTTALTPECQR